MASSSEKKPKTNKKRPQLDILAGESGSDSDPDLTKIQIDQSYARRLEHNKRREDLQRYDELKKQGRISDSDCHLDDSDDSSFSDSELGRRRDDLRLASALVRIRSNDPSIYDKDAKLFSESESDSAELDKPAKGKKAKKERPLYLKDVNAKHLLEDGPEFGTDSEADEQKSVHPKAYNEQQKEQLKAFLDAEKAASHDNNGDDDELLKVKSKKSEENDEDEDEDDERIADEMWGEYFGVNLDEKDRFLRDYLVKRTYLETKKEKFDMDGIRDVSDEEDELDKQDEYEAVYNFRHEEAAASGAIMDRVMGHSRVVEGSVRRKESSRKQQRKAREERMAQAKREREDEIKRLKNLKKKEINEKLEKIRMAGGISRDAECKLGVDDSDEEFDVEEHYRKLEEVYGEGYYDAEDADPVFGTGEEEEFGNEHDDEEDGNEEYENKKKRKVSLMEKAEKAEFDKEMEEYYKLDYEDAIGDIKTRFNYRSVPARSYGLHIEEIMKADDKDLNQYVSMKKIAPYTEKEWEVTYHKKKSKSLILGGAKTDDKKSKDGKRSRLQEGPSSSELEKEKQANEQAETSGKRNSTRSIRRARRNAELKLSRSRLMAYGKIHSKPQKKH